MFKRKLLILFVVFSLCLSLVSCRNSEEKATATPKDKQTESGTEFDLTPESTKIVVWPRASGTKEDDPTKVAFIRKYPEYEVDNSVGATSGFLLQDPTQDLQRLAGAVASNEQPDLFMGLMTSVEAYYSNLFQPIHDFLMNDPEVNYDSFDSFIFDSATFNDKIYFMPTAYSVPVLLYNKNLFEEVGLDPEKPPTTWSEFQEYNERLVTYDSTGVIKTIGYHTIDWALWGLVSTGKQLTDPTGFTFEFDTPEHVKLMEFARSIPEAYGGIAKLPAGLDFYEGTVGMIQGSTGGMSLTPLLIQGAFEFGLAELPKPDGMEEEYVPIDCSANYCIPRAAKNPKGGWLFLKFYMTDSRYDSIVETYNLNPMVCIFDYIPHIPTREMVYEEYKDILTEKSWEYINKRDEIIRKVNMSENKTVVHSTFIDYFRPEYERMLNHEISPKELLSNAESYVKSLISDMKNRKIEERWTFNEDGTILPPPDSEEE